MTLTRRQPLWCTHAVSTHVGRERGLPLEAIRRSLDDPSFDRRAALVEQRHKLAGARRAYARDDSCDRRGAHRHRGERHADCRHAQDFDGFDPGRYEDEAQARWGETDAYESSRKRAKSYTEADWRAIKEEQAEIYAQARAALAAQVRPDEPQAMDIAERHRQSIERWFYPCSPAMHEGLADLWEADRRYADNIDQHGAGLTQFLAAAVRANARRASASSA